MRKSNLERIREKKRAEYKKVETDIAGLFQILLGDVPGPTQWAFISDPARIKAFMGAAGSGKTRAGAASGIARALLQPGSKGLVARYDYNDLKDTTALAFEEMVNKLPKGVLADRDKAAPMKWWLHPAVEGDVSQITFMGLKDPVGSYEFNWIFVDEADECEEGRVLELDTRLRAPGGDYTLMMAFNPPPKTHWLYTACTGLDFQARSVRDPWVKLFRPEKGENSAHLPFDYYEQIMRGKPQEMVTRLVEGEWGANFAGTPVYPEFRVSQHVRDLSNRFFPSEPLLRFWDFGFTHPCCLWAQLTWEGRLLVFRECLGQDEEATAFVKRCKAITNVEFPSAKRVLDFGDPAVNQRKDTGSTLAEFAKEGVIIRYVTTHFDQQIRMVRQLLNRTIAGEAAFQIDRKCIITVDGFKGGYARDDRGEKPRKDGFYDHPLDAVRYGIANVFAGAGLVLDHLPESVAYDRRSDPLYLLQEPRKG